MIYIPDLRLAYYPIPKCGCTSIKLAIINWAIENKGLKCNLRVPKDVHGKLHTEKSYIVDNRIREITEPPEGKYFEFAIVRDPILRFISGWQNKIMIEYQYNNCTIPYSPELAARIPFKSPIDDLAETIYYLSKQDFFGVDYHWLPQSRLFPKNINLFLLNHKYPLDDRLKGFHGVAFKDLHIPSVNVSRKKSCTGMLPSKGQELVKLAYKEDYQEFGDLICD